MLFSLLSWLYNTCSKKTTKVEPQHQEMILGHACVTSKGVDYISTKSMNEVKKWGIIVGGALYAVIQKHNCSLDFEGHPSILQ